MSPKTTPSAIRQKNPRRIGDLCSRNSALSLERSAGIGKTGPWLRSGAFSVFRFLFHFIQRVVFMLNSLWFADSRAIQAIFSAATAKGIKRRSVTPVNRGQKSEIRHLTSDI